MFSAILFCLLDILSCWEDSNLEMRLLICWDLEPIFFGSGADAYFILDGGHECLVELVMVHIELLCCECWGVRRKDVVKCCGGGRKSAFYVETFLGAKEAWVGG